MIREIAISIYLFIFRIVFNLNKLFPQRKKTVFITSFGDNASFTIQALENATDHKIVILISPRCKIKFEKSKRRKTIGFQDGNPIGWVRSIYHLATCKKVFVDNYYGFLAVTDFHPNVECIQLWHAAGAIKQFGLKDLSIKNRSYRAYERFKRVYKRFNYVVVGSEKMAVIFQEGFGITEKQLLRTGIPRTDFFYDTFAKNNAEVKLRLDLPINNIKKKVILYAPTYRDNELTIHELKLNIKAMYEALREHYVLFLSLHPAVDVDLQNDFHDFVFDVSCYHINEVLVVTDILITDYSSIPVEFSLLHKPMIFFAYDLEEYANERGFWENYEELVPGPIVETTEEIIGVIRHGEYDMSSVLAFASEWNKYSLGYSSNNLIKTLYEK